MNVRAAFIHLLGDLVQAVGVIVAALIIYFRPEWKIADPITTFIFAILVLMTTVPIFMQCMSILLEFAPEDLDVKELYSKINDVSHLITNLLVQLECVSDIKDFHVWALNEEKSCCSMKVTTEKDK